MHVKTLRKGLQCMHFEQKIPIKKLKYFPTNLLVIGNYRFEISQRFEMTLKNQL